MAKYLLEARWVLVLEAAVNKVDDFLFHRVGDKIWTTRLLLLNQQSFHGLFYRTSGNSEEKPDVLEGNNLGFMSEFMICHQELGLICQTYHEICRT